MIVEMMEKLQKNGISANYNDISRLCKKYYIVELAVFGFMVKDGGGSGDLGFLVSFEEGAQVTLFDVIDLEKEFSQLLNRKVEIVEKASLRNPVRKDRILAAGEVIYASSWK